MADDDIDRMFLFSSEDEDDDAATLMRFDVGSEQDVWDALRALNNQDDLSEAILINFTDLSWASLSVSYTGDKFHSSLTANAMKGLVDFQTSFYQTIALILHGSKKASVLTDEELSGFELVFVVRNGSSEVDAKAEEQLLKALAEAIGNMNPKHVASAICLAIVLYFGKGGLDLYLNHVAEVKKIEEQGQSEKGLQDIIRDQNQTTKENMKLLGELLRKNETANEIVTGSINAHDSIVRHSNDSNGVTIKGQKLTPKAVSEITSQSRRSGKDRTFDDIYAIELVDPSNPKQFNIKVRSLNNGRVFVARLRDALAMAEFKKVIRDAEWNRSIVRLRVSARIVGDQVKNAEILSASLVHR